MPDAPLSRRARRTFEQEAAERASMEEPTQSFPEGNVQGDAHGVDSAGTIISRRDRRRMERLAHPLEAWTAEEEMIATGQIPVMTPERIAEQERISRQKAEQAAQEAAAASQELRRLAEAEVRRAQEYSFDESAFEAPVSQVPAFDTPVARPPVYEAPVISPFALAEPDEEAWPETVVPVEPESPGFGAPVISPFALAEPDEEAWPETVTRVEPAPDAPDAPAAEHESHAERPIVEPYQPIMALDDVPLAQVAHAVHHDEPELDEPVLDEPVLDEPVLDEHGLAAPDIAEAPQPERSHVFDALFPPGSSQVALRQQDPFANTAPAEAGAQAQAVSGQIPTLLPPQEVPERELNPIEEMRRLAAEAMSGIDRAAKADEAALAALESRSAEAPPATDSGQTPVAPRPLVEETPWQSGPVQGAPSPAAPEAQRAPQEAPGGAEFAWPTVGQVGEQQAPASGQLPTQGQHPAQGQFPTQGQFPMPGQLAPASGQFPMPAQQPLAQPQGPAWTSQALPPVQGHAADPNDFTPLSNVPTPDFSGLFKPGAPAAFPPVTGGLSTTGITQHDPTATGQTAAIRRPDLPEVGGAKHFKWLHLAVIGALMFVLGVVIYNAAFAQ